MADVNISESAKLNDPQSLIPITTTLTSPGIYIKVGGLIIGRVQSVSPTQNQGATPIYETGTHGIVEMIPGQPSYTLNITKMAIRTANLLQVLSQGMVGADDGTKQKYTALQSALSSGSETNSQVSVFATIQQFVMGFDIDRYDVIPVGYTNAGKSLITTYKNCLLTSYSETINASGDLVVTETAAISFQKIVRSQG